MIYQIFHCRGKSFSAKQNLVIYITENPGKENPAHVTETQKEDQS